MPRKKFLEAHKHLCAHPGCQRLVSYNAIHCRAHHVQPSRESVPAETRFWRHVDKNAPGGCWVWTGSRTPQGYGGFRPTRQNLVPAYRFSFEMANGPIPPGMCIDHVCHNPACVNPDHLRLATQAQNLWNMVLPKTNTSGLKGAFWVKNRGRWMSQIKVDGRLIYLGYFDTAEEAHAAYCRAAEIHHGGFANFGEVHHAQS